MSYAAYATIEDCIDYGIERFDGIGRALRQASRHIDSLTYNRIVGAGFENLTPFQQEIIKETVCRQAQFEHENEDLISAVLSSYSINGVSMQFGSTWNISVENGVAIQRDLLGFLSQTGLCCRMLEGWQA